MFGRVIHDVDVGVDPIVLSIVGQVLYELIMRLCRHRQVVPTDAVKNDVKEPDSICCLRFDPVDQLLSRYALFPFRRTGEIIGSLAY